MASINLNKDNAGVGNGAMLVEDDGSAQKRLKFGAKWDASARGKSGVLGFLSKKGGLDIDLIGVLMQGRKAVKYAGLDSLDPLAREGSPVVHTGDSLTGEDNKRKLKKSGLTSQQIELLDDEAIDITSFEAIPMDYDAIFFTASVFKKGGMADATHDQGFQGANNVEFRMYSVADDGRETEDALIMPDLGATANCCLIAKVSRTSATDPKAPWKVEVLEEMVSITRGDINSLLEHCRQRM